MKRPGWTAALLVPLALLLEGCAGPELQTPGPGGSEPRLTSYQVIAGDGYRLPLRHWPATEETEVVVLAIHGFNDHAGSFEIMASALNEHGIEVYAHDQRGFGTTAQRRVWPGYQRLRDDVLLLAALLRERHPDTPLYLVGKSMGAAVTLLAMSADEPPPVDGSVLISPAVWSREAMPWYQRLGLWLGVRLIPQVSFSIRTPRRLGIEPTDDEAIKRQLASDPLILRSARVDTLYGLTRTMGLALEAASELPPPALVLYGDEDQIIPMQAYCALLRRLPDDEGIRLALYPGGYHMLTRYTRRDRTEQDLAAWLLAPGGKLPSGYEVTRESTLASHCD
ncbi:alpha/beta hydrolase [Halomonas sp. MCCC 1A17488]|uniref:Alpha/beta hydrolase n=1 Tax=Billgrantia sulfidoxydans TaxID=2733484 RepID=A0ABX7W2A6_9GAMM|nr:MULTISPECIES: alpha/beta hydrolase [Halomonas]MCE8015694.1 alpha/beta hydrolase [Halomonas sp. MCCC 1A17488]MCG3239027.1 alpha/beta hydrolase [Halomonas sp. MCCC 1A17488]QPP51022.1 lysophospholipase [Halomonas sp. SS10-MC5]QTP54534.1 alpha/beta hydrolase [Halomonas sulfidoxydans]